MGVRVGTLCGFGVATLCLLLIFAAPLKASATTGVNQKISFEGKIVTAAGVNIPDGTYNMEFKIYTAAGSCNPTTGVGCTLGWTEDWLVSAGNGVTFTSGTYHVDLDTVANNNFSGINFNTYPLYLSLQIGNTSSCSPFSSCGGDGEMKPYILLTSTPYALNSDLLDGLDSTAFGQLSTNNTWTGTNLVKVASSSAFQVQNSSNNSIFTVDTSANQVLLGKAGGSGVNGSLAFYNSSGTNTITLTAQSTNPANSVTISLPTAGATGTQCLQSTSGSTSTATTLQFGSCSGVATTLATAYSGGSSQTDSTITLDSTRLGIIIKDANSAISGSLFTVQNNAGTTKYLDVSSGAFAIQAGTTLTMQSASGSAFTASALGAGQSNFATAGTGTSVLGNSTGSTELKGPLYTTSTKGVLIGDGTVTATPLLLQLDNSSQQGAEAAGDCSTTINSGAIYYSAATAASNTTTNEVRGCVDGAWTDIVTADQLGVLLLGVVQDSGPTNPGDIGGLSGYANAPCKVAWASTTSVTVAPCTAYSGGRKVVVSSTVTITGLGTAGSVRFQHICLNGTNGAPTATASNTSETTGLPAFSGSAPILCLATVKLSTTPAITNIYDTRTFTTSVKEFVGNSVALAPGWMVIVDATGDNLVTDTTTAGASGVRGAVAVGNPSASTTNVGAIIVVSGPAYVKFTSAPTVGGAVQTSTTAGYMATTTTTSKFGLYRDLGQAAGNGNSASCNAATNCQWSALVDVLPY